MNIPVLAVIVGGSLAISALLLNAVLSYVDHDKPILSFLRLMGALLAFACTLVGFQVVLMVERWFS